MSFEWASPRGIAAVAALITALGSTSLARAGSPEDRAAARQHANQAQELAKKGKHAEACGHWQEVERLDPKLPTLMELAACSEKLGRVVEAQGFWALARDRAKRDEKPQSKARAEERLAAVQKRVAQLTLQLAPSAPAGAQVLRDDVPIEPAALGGALPTNPGEHVIVVKLAGHDDAKYSVKLAAGDKQTVAIDVGPQAKSQSSPPPAAALPAASPLPSAAPAPASPTVAAPPPPAEPQAPTGWWSEQRTAGVIFGSAGLVGLGVGSVLLVSAKGDAGDRGATVGAISLAGGGVLLLSGLVLLVSAPSNEPAQHAGVTVTPALLAAQGGPLLGAVGQF